MAVLSESSAREAETEAVSDPCRGSGRQFPPAGRSLLIGMIEGEIIPRLVLAYGDHAMRRKMTGNIGMFGDAEAVANLFITADSTDIRTRLQTLNAEGVTRERIYLDLLAPVAHTLRIFWEEGRCTLDDVARGLSCVGQVLHDMKLEDKFQDADIAESH